MEAEGLAGDGVEVGLVAGDLDTFGEVLTEREPDAIDQRVPGHWEGDLIIGQRGASAGITLAERTSRFIPVLALSNESEHPSTFFAKNP